MMILFGCCLGSDVSFVSCYLALHASGRRHPIAC
uniref:Uncharacterized protein n=1 Tax=Arundo donax TaxID=35708 RepID=A0A0A8YX47_ARUDO